jgi:hypothetical protein
MCDVCAHELDSNTQYSSRRLAVVSIWHKRLGGSLVDRNSQLATRVCKKVPKSTKDADSGLYTVM